MNQEIKSKWVAALRSGEYVQGKGRLRDTSRQEVCHCVLGVLVDLYVKEHDSSWVGSCKSNYELPAQVRDWADVEPIAKNEVKINGDVRSLIFHNDGGATFLELADAIESQL